MSDHDNKCEFMLAPPDMNRLGLCLCKERALKARLAEELAAQDFTYNRKTNDLIERHAKQIDALRSRLANAERERDEIKRFWFSDADPKETRFADEYAAREGK